VRTSFSASKMNKEKQKRERGKNFKPFLHSPSSNRALLRITDDRNSMNFSSISRRDRVLGVPLTRATMLQEKRACGR